MTESKNYYEILGIAPVSSLKEIKMAFKAQIRRHHPDKNIEMNIYEVNIPNPSNRKDNKKQISMKIIEAYQCLIDQQKRKLYDHQLYSQSLKSQLFSVRHKDTVSLSSKVKQNYCNFQPDSSEFNSKDVNFDEKGGIKQDLQGQNFQDVDSDEQEQDENTIFVCQQCFGQMQIPNKQLEQLNSKQLSINCRNCGLYMTIVE